MRVQCANRTQTPLHATQRTTEMARLATTHCVPLREQKSCTCKCRFSFISVVRTIHLMAVISQRKTIVKSKMLFLSILPQWNEVYNSFLNYICCIYPWLHLQWYSTSVWFYSVIRHQFVSTVCFYIGDSTLTEPCSIWQYSKKEEDTDDSFVIDHKSS